VTVFLPLGQSFAFAASKQCIAMADVRSAIWFVSKQFCIVTPNIVIDASSLKATPVEMRFCADQMQI
jgi:hypothetical protein